MEKRQLSENICLSLSFLLCVFCFPVGVPGVAEEPVVLPLLPPDQPLPEGSVVEHPAAVTAPQQKRGELLQPLCELGPWQRPPGQGAGIHHLKQLEENGTRFKFVPFSAAAL